MNYRLTPLTSHETGAEIVGLDLKAPASAELRKAINAEFAKYHVLVFRDQKMTAAEFADAGKIFGELMSHHHKDVRADGHPDVYEIRNERIGPGEYRIAGATFHTDHSNHPIPPKATALHPVSLPSRGGDTQYVNMHNAYDDLPEAMKRRIEHLRAVHVFESKFSPRKLRPLDEKSREALRSNDDFAEHLPALDQAQALDGALERQHLVDHRLHPALLDQAHERLQVVVVEAVRAADLDLEAPDIAQVFLTVAYADGIIPQDAAGPESPSDENDDRWSALASAAIPALPPNWCSP